MWTVAASSRARTYKWKGQRKAKARADALALQQSAVEHNDAKQMQSAAQGVDKPLHAGSWHDITVESFRDVIHVVWF